MAEAIASWGRRTGALDVTIAPARECGLLDPQARSVLGAPAPTPAECRPVGQAANAAVTAGRPEVVIVLPSTWDLADVRLGAAGEMASWTDPAFAKTAAAQYRARTESWNRSGSVVMWVNAAVTDASASRPAGSVVAATDALRAPAFDAALRDLVGAVPRDGAQRVDLAGWAATSVPSLHGPGKVDPAAATVMGEWVAAQVYLQYDSHPKLQTPKPPNLAR
jgi:hypothetical protein